MRKRLLSMTRGVAIVLTCCIGPWFLKAQDEDIPRDKSALEHASTNEPSNAERRQTSPKGVRLAIQQVPFATLACELEENVGGQASNQIVERLLALLVAIPQRWNEFSDPLVPRTGRTAEELLEGASKEDEQRIATLFSHLALCSPEERLQALRNWLKTMRPVELDLWLPGRLARRQLGSNFSEAASTTEVWLQLADVTGRQDVLLDAASLGFHLILSRLGPGVVSPVLRTWTEISSSIGPTRGRAKIMQSYAVTLFRSGLYEEALQAFRNAGKMLESVGDRSGPIYCQQREADVLFHMGEDERALRAYRGARSLFEAAGNRVGEASSLRGEADVLNRLGQHDQALEKYRAAGKLFQTAGNFLGQGNAMVGEAEVFFLSGEHDLAVDAYHNARSLFEKAGDRLGQGNALRGEADVLFTLGHINEAGQAYRAARAAFEAAGDPLGQGNAYLGLARVLVLLGNHEAALEAFDKARPLFEEVGYGRGLLEIEIGKAQLLSLIGHGAQVLQIYRDSRNLPGSDDAFYQAFITVREAESLLSLGEYEQALQSYRDARALFEVRGDLSGQGRAWIGEAEALVSLGDGAGALRAYREARSLFEAANDLNGVGKTWIGEAKVHLDLGQHEQATQAFRKARANYEITGDRLGQAEAQLGLAEIFYREDATNDAGLADRSVRGLLEGALNQLEWTVNRVGEVPDDQPWVLFHLGNHEPALQGYRNPRALVKSGSSELAWIPEADKLLSAGQSDRAFQAYRRARTRFESVGDRVGEAHTWIGEADVRLSLGENAQALRAYRVAREMLESVGYLSGQGYSWIGEADVLLHLGKNSPALQAFRNIRTLRDALEYEPGKEVDWDDLFEQSEELVDDVAFLKGLKAGAERGKNAITLLMGDEKGQDLYRHIHDGLTTVAGMRKSAMIGGDQVDELSLRGDREQARIAFENATALLGIVKSSLFAQVNHLGNETDFLAQVDRLQQALRSYRTARTLFESTNDKRGQGTSWIGEADVFLLMGENQRAVEYYRRARAFFGAVGSRLGQGSCFLGEGHALREQWDWQGAATAAVEAGEHFESSKAPAGQISALLLEAFARERLGEWTPATKAAQRAIDLHERLRETRSTDRHRTSEDVTISGALGVLIRTQLRHGRFSEALTLAEKARSRVLLDMLTTDPHLRGSVAPPRLQATAPRLRKELRRVEALLASTTGSARHRLLKMEQRRLDEELLWNRYELIVAQGNPLGAGESLDAAAIQVLARDAGTILLYYTTVSEVIGWLVIPGREEPIVRRLYLPRGALEKQVRTLSAHLANPLFEPQSGSLARSLWDRLIAPFAEVLETGGVLHVIPHGPLHELPFTALLDREGIPLFERWQLSIAPSASTLAACRKRHSPVREDDSLQTFSSGRGLLVPTQESNEISSFFKIFQPVEARFEDYELQVPRARQLFIATRGVHEQGSRTGTYLELQPGENHDSRLSAAEIATIPINAELVTLAACDTAAGQALLSDERLDLVRAFLIAGTASVLATRWKVPEDDRTTQFLVDFYREYRRGGPDGKGTRKDVALTKARRSSRERGDPAQVWAAWVLVGDPR